MPKAETNGTPPWNHILGAFAFQVIALVVYGWINRHALNPDGVSYLRIASYYATGETDLAVTAYWAPLLSWIIAPLLKLGIAPPPAARLALGMSAVLFFWACVLVFRQFRIPRRWFCCGVWITTAVSVLWSGEYVTPDLLLGGLVAFAFATMMSERWLDKPAVPFASGLLWGLAYLCKAVALPFGILVTFGIGWLWARQGRAGVVRGMAWTLAGMLLLSAPWIGIISRKDQRFTISSSARLNHALVQAPAKPLFPLDLGFREPERGRITTWENPSWSYPDWSSFGNLPNAALQLRTVAVNIPRVLFVLTSLNLIFPFVLAVGLLRLLRRSPLVECNRISWAALPIVALAMLYVPNFFILADQRYFYAVFPFLFVVSLPLFSLDVLTVWKVWLQRVGPLLLAVAFILPPFARMALRPGWPRMAGDTAYVLAGKMTDAGVSGSMAGSGNLPGGRAGLYTAFHLGQPWFGDEPQPSVSGFQNSGAKLIVVNRGSAIAQELEGSAAFRNMDAQLFGSADEARSFPLQVFAVFSANSDGPPP